MSHKGNEGYIYFPIDKRNQKNNNNMCMFYVSETNFEFPVNKEEKNLL